MVTNIAHNVLSNSSKTVYLNEPMDKAPDEEDKTEPQEGAESPEPTSAQPQQEDKTDWKKRHDDLKTHYDRTKTSFESQISELKTQISELSSKMAAESKVKAPKTKEEFEAFKAKYPELVDHILTAATMVSENAQNAVTEKLKQLENQQKAYSAERGIEELKKYHPDFIQIKDDPRFIDWFNAQSEEIKNLIRSPKPEVIAKGLDMYKAHAGIKPRAETKKDATREVKTPGRVQIGEPGKRTYTNAEIMKMSMKEFEANQDDIKAAQYDGRIVG